MDLSKKTGIVVWDPEGEFWEGALIDHRGTWHKVAGRGGVVLPCVPDLFRRSGVGGYHKRSWGSGIPLDGTAPRQVSPMLVYAVPELRMVHWAARLVPGGAPRTRTGFLRLAPDGTQAVPNRMGLTSDPAAPDNVTIDKLGPADARGGWNVGGHCLIAVPGPGHYPLSLYGVADGLRVAWSAVSLAAE